MKKNVRKIFTIMGFLCMISVSYAHAYIYKIDVWHKLDSGGNTIQKLYCLSDMHGEIPGLLPEDVLQKQVVEQEQRAALRACCEKQSCNEQRFRDGQELSGEQQVCGEYELNGRHNNHDSVLFIVEDNKSPTDVAHKKVATYLNRCKQHVYAQPGGARPPLLHFLADILRDRGGQVINVEDRQLRSASRLMHTCLVDLRKVQSPVLQQFQHNINNLYGPTLKEVAQEFRDSIARAQAYGMSDGKTLGSYYAATLADLEKTMPFADFLSQQDGCYWDYIDAVQKQDRLWAHNYIVLLQSAIAVWGAELLDMHALHALYNAADKDKVCIIMGAMHIRGISVLLPHIGYCKVRTVGTDTLTEREHDERVAFIKEYMNVNQFIVPKESPTWWNSVVSQKSPTWWDYIKSMVTLPIKLVYGFLQGRRMKVLTEKWILAQPVSRADFDVLVHK